MGSGDRLKKRIQLWKKALVHFALCFVMGFFTGFAPTSSVSLFTSRNAEALRAKFTDAAAVTNRSLMAELEPLVGSFSSNHDRRQLIVVTTTRSGDRWQDALMRRMAGTLRLVQQPLLWVVVQAASDSDATAEVLRKTGVMYRHLAFKENLTDAAAEDDHQRNVALSHIERHRLAGIVHFADLSNVYDLQFFQELRNVEVFGAWPMAMVSANRKRVVVDGPICNSSNVLGWISEDLSNAKFSLSNLIMKSAETIKAKPPKINISGFAFNSSILWDPERWGRSINSVPDTSQDSMRFVQEVLLEDETKMKGIPADCSKIMLWRLHIHESRFR
ncbi:beta-1,4-xylosyltransferase IRX9-like [Curcuma longa]|uniref:beta-1,4-xylosyltransferase IRX9-like n=1 Tax=Curcuma longa TaxID=136217 RepID=UPI003D9EA8FA